MSVARVGLGAWVSVVLSVMVAATAAAQYVPYGGYLTHDGVPVTESVPIEVCLFEVETGGAPLECERHESVEVREGWFTLELEALPFSTASDPHLELRVDGQPLLPRQRIGAVPLALEAVEVPGGADALPDAFVTATQSRLDSLGEGLEALGTRVDDSGATLETVHGLVVTVEADLHALDDAVGTLADVSDETVRDLGTLLDGVPWNLIVGEPDWLLDDQVNWHDIVGRSAALADGVVEWDEIVGVPVILKAAPAVGAYCPEPDAERVTQVVYVAPGETFAGACERAGFRDELGGYTYEGGVQIRPGVDGESVTIRPFLSEVWLDSPASLEPGVMTWACCQQRY